MSDRQALVAAIIAHPDEDTPRLAFADWLDERGDRYFADWAALIRAQVEAAQVERFSPPWVDLVRRQAALFEKRKADWDLTWGSRLGPTAYRRGFREAAAFEARGFAHRADLLFGENPLRAVKLGQLTNRQGRVLVPDLPVYPGFARVEALDLSENRPAVARWFVDEAAPRMPRLRALGLSRLGLDAAQAADFLVGTAPHAPALAAVDLSDNPLFALGWAGSLFRSPALARVRWLGLHNTHPSPEALLTLSDSPHAAGLRVLELGRQLYSLPSGGFGPEGADLLTAGSALRNLEVLDLTAQEIGPEGAAALARSPLLATVRELRLGYNEVGDAGARALAGSPHARSLRLLDLGFNAVGPDGAAALVESPHLANLGMLVLGGYGTPPGAGLPEPLAGRLNDRFPRVEWPSPLFEPCP